MGRELSMVRRLEKLEKELGYCEIKLEKQQRLRLQLEFLRFRRSSLARTVEEWEAREKRAEQLDPAGRAIAGVPIRDVREHLILERDRPKRSALEEHFRVAGSLDAVRVDLHSIGIEISTLEERIENHNAFAEKRERLLEDREIALERLGPTDDTDLPVLSREFERIEGDWNVMTEDLTNLDSAIRHVEHALDYLRSARSFSLNARSQFDLDRWLVEGYLIDLFKHSSLGRAKEMVEGADRNLASALQELVCLEDFTIDPADFEPNLEPFLDELFADIFGDGKIVQVIEMLEIKLERLTRLLDRLNRDRDDLFERQSTHEEQRIHLFSKMGDERRKVSTATH